MTRSINITGDGQSDYLDLYEGDNIVYVQFVASASGTLTPQRSKRRGEGIAFKVINGTTEAETISADSVFVVTGPGLLSFSGASVSGTIKVELEDVEG